MAERSAMEAKSIVPTLPGHPLWSAMADAALSIVLLARGQLEEAAQSGRQVIAALEGAMQEDLWLEVLLPAADALMKGGTPEESEQMQEQLRLTLALLAQRILDENIRVRWFRSPIGRELTRLAGPLTTRLTDAQAQPESSGLADAETQLLRMLTEGRTNEEISAESGLAEDEVVRRLAELFAKLGASSRADATAFALMRKLV
jgi:DNA-binding NarL/FixJ family response regulator